MKVFECKLWVQDDVIVDLLNDFNPEISKIALPVCSPDLAELSPKNE